MAERYSDRVHAESVVLDIGQDIGALIIYTGADLLGCEIEVSRCGNVGGRVHVEVLERRAGGQPVFAAVFPSLQEGEYDIWHSAANPVGAFTVLGGQVITVDWRGVRPETRLPSAENP